MCNGVLCPAMETINALFMKMFIQFVGCGHTLTYAYAIVRTHASTRTHARQLFIVNIN